VVEGLILSEITDETARNAYEATEDVDATYYMVDVPLGFGVIKPLEKVRFIGGFRREDYLLDLFPHNPVTGAAYWSNILQDTVRAGIDETKILPSYNLVFNLPRDIKIRLAYSETVARAEFREIAPFEFQEFYGGAVAVGYPYLKTTGITNLDLRFEWYPSANQLLAISAFRKDFDNPIEVYLFRTTDLLYRTYQNALSASTQGVELDTRLNLPFIPLRVGTGTIIMNATWAHSEVAVDTVITMFNGVQIANQAFSSRRPLQGQSDFVANVALNMKFVKGYDFALAYNVFSKRLASLGVGALGDIYEYPFHSLNLTTGIKLGSFKISLRAKNILNSSVRFGVQEDRGTNEIKYSKTYEPGISGSIGLSYSF
jgi:outer membrane receptor protein involved in Fe transport